MKASEEKENNRKEYEKKEYEKKENDRENGKRSEVVPQYSCRITSTSESETVKVGFQLGTRLKEGDIVCIEGELGAGKTVFVKGIAEAISVNEYVTSPTFTIVNEYNGRYPFYHFDVYRLAGAEDLFEIGFEEYIYGNGITVIEWADLIKEILPPRVIWVNIEKKPLDIDIDIDIERDSTVANAMIKSSQEFALYEKRIITVSFSEDSFKNFKNGFRNCFMVQQ